MAVDNRPFKSKEQDGQGNEIIIRDQQLVEQGTATTMASGACFETRDVDDRPVKIPRDNMMNIVLECIGIILNDSSRNLGTNVQKALGLQGNTVGHSTVLDFASVLGGINPTALTPSDDMNNVIKNGFYEIQNAQRPANCPSWGGFNSIIYVRTFTQGTRVVQFLYEANTYDFGFRSWYLGESIPDTWVKVNKS